MGALVAGYAATKHALAGLTKAYADDFAEYNIQINGIAPGYYVSEMTAIIYNNPKIKRVNKRAYTGSTLGKGTGSYGRNGVPRQCRFRLCQWTTISH